MKSEDISHLAKEAWAGMRVRCRKRIAIGNDGSCRLVHSCDRPKGHHGPHGCWAHHPNLWDWVPDSNRPGYVNLVLEFSAELEAKVYSSFGRESE